ncbi:hypothetical protein [Yoonia sp.]|uniref:hypothetical protein n=1 Tax=Yoonia sp. TaxID=2212373 RepID=UPI0025CC068E|nr:hypothetical protein [Yoonia sp.]
MTSTTVAALLLGSCAVWDAAKTKVENIQELPAVEVIGLGVNEPCAVDRSGARRLSGAYLRTVAGSLGGMTFAVTGKANKPSTAPLPRNMAIDDRVLRSLGADDEGQLTGWRQSVAAPIAALNTRTTLPLAYNLSYRAAGTDYTGPLVVGIPPLQDNVPLLGQASHSGAVAITYTTVGDDGSTAISTAIGSFTMLVGYGSGRATFRAGDFTVTDGAALPFARLRWTRLGLCGARLVSSGQGVASLYDADERRVPTLGPNADPTAGVLLFDASQFAASDTTDAPSDVGGVFAIQGDATSLTGVFLSRPPP